MTIKQIQCLLTYLGYSPGVIDGVNGIGTQAATRAFQADYGLTADGIPGVLTQKMLVGAIAGTAAKVEHPESSDKPKTGTFWDDIRYFTRAEFRCPCGRCGGFPVEPQESMVRTVDEIRRRLGIPISIVDGGGSGVRCAAHNAEVGGVSNSQHLYGLAADLHGAVSPTEMKAVAEEVMGHTGGIGVYSWGIHVDTRQGYARWNGYGSNAASSSFDSLRDFLSFRAEVNDGRRKTVKTGFPSLDGILGGFACGGLYVIAARPSVGKSALGVAMADMMARESTVLYASLEMSAAELNARRVAAFSTAPLHFW